MSWALGRPGLGWVSPEGPALGRNPPHDLGLLEASGKNGAQAAWRGGCLLVGGPPTAFKDLNPGHWTAKWVPAG